MPGPPRESASEGLLAEEAKEQAEKVAPAGRFGGYAVAAPAAAVDEDEDEDEPLAQAAPSAPPPAPAPGGSEETAPLTEAAPSGAAEPGAAVGAEGGGVGAPQRLETELVPRRATPTLNYVFHACLCGGFFGLGIVLCMLGPTLLDMSEQAGGASVKEISLVFTSRSLSYLLGSVLGGVLLEKMENTCAMLAVAMYLVAIGSAGLPLCTAIWSMGCFMACAGVSMGLLDTGANVVTLRLWGDQAEPFVQSLHAAFALGALVAPILAEQFISHGIFSQEVAANCDASAGQLWTASSAEPPEQEVTVGEGVRESSGDVKWAFWISSIIMMPSAIGLTLLTPQWTTLTANAVNAQGADGSTTPPRKHPPGYERNVLGLGLCVFGLYVGCEIGYGGYIFSFSVSSCALQFTESSAAYLTATYWAMFTAGRLLAIPLSLKFAPRTLTALDVCGCLVAACLMAAFPGSEQVVWGSTALFGLSLASVFPSTFTLLERHRETPFAFLEKER